MRDAGRMLDANLNRAREALRVMEDCARFVLEDAELAAGLKEARHGVREIVDASPEACRCVLAWRDTPGDVGTPITSDAERNRATIRDVAAAAGKRAGEALRVVEECVKLHGPNLGGMCKALRYRVYELERRLILALGTGRARQWRLCVLITESLCLDGAWERVSAAALDGGAECLQLREKSLVDAELLRRARRLSAMCRERGAACIVNDRADIALLAGADGAHLGQEDVCVGDVRRLAGMTLLVGVSTTNMEQARAAAADGADYCGVGPMFATTTKEKPQLAGPAYLREYLAEARTARLPHLAIGGIGPRNVAELVAAGARGVAVSSAVCGAKDPAGVCREILSFIPAMEGDR
jgi:thiamine-phosphate pyrophosphorylase